MDLVTTEEAASLLGVSARRVQQMLDAGVLSRVARGLVDRTSVERLLVAGHLGRTRVWSEPTAWAAVALLSGVAPNWLGDVQASRLRAALREISDATGLVVRCRERATVGTYDGHRSVASRLRASLVLVDTNALGLVDDARRVDGYLASNELDGTVRRYGLQESATGNITLRSTEFNMNVVTDLAQESIVLAALDVASSLDPRERGVGESVLTESLERFR